MSAEFYAEIAADAEEQIAEFGREAVLLRRGQPTTNETQPWRPDREAPTEIPVHILQADNSLTNASGTVVQQNDLFGFLVGAAPDGTRDRLRTDGHTYEFVRVKPLAPGVGAVLYEFHARR